MSDLPPVLRALVLFVALGLTSATARPATPQRTTAPPARVRADPDREGPFVLRGRLVDEDGAGLSGVPLEVEVHSESDPNATVAPEGPLHTDAEGRFELRVDDDRPRLVHVWARPADREHVGWSVFTREHVSPLNLARTTARREAVLVGHLEDAQGELLVEDWEVWVQPHELLMGPRSNRNHQLEIDPDDGAFRIGGLAPGTYVVQARKRGRPPAPAAVVRLASGQVRSIALVDGEAVERDVVTVRVRTAGPFPFRPWTDAVFAVDRNGRRSRMARFDTDRWYADGSGEAPFDVLVEDPAWRPERITGLVPGGVEPTVTLRGATVRLDVRAPDPAAVHGVTVDLAHAVVPQGVLSHRRGLRLDELAGGRLEGLPAGDLTLRVHAPGRPARDVRVLGLVKDEERVVQLDLGGPGELDVRVTGPEGRSVAGARVLVVARVPVSVGAPLRSGASSWFPEVPRHAREVLTEVVTDGDGRAQVPGVPAGEVVVCAALGPYAFAEARCEVRSSEATRVELELPAVGRVRVTPRLAAPHDPAWATVLVRPADPTPGPVWVERRWLGSLRGYHQNGTWTFEGVPAGPVTMTVFDHESIDGVALLSERLELGAGDTLEVVPDLTDLRWTEGSVITNTHGRPLRGVGLVLEATEDPTDPPAAFQRVERGSTALHFVRTIRSGSYRLRVVHPRDGWTWTDPRVHPLVPDEPFSLVVDVPLVECHVRLVDEEGRAWAQRPVAHGDADGGALAARVTPDAEGRVVLFLPPGPHAFLDARGVPQDAPLPSLTPVPRGRIDVPEGEGPFSVQVPLRGSD